MSRPRAEGATVAHKPARAAAGKAAYRVQWWQGEGADRKPAARWFATEAEALALQQAIEARLVRQPVVAAGPTPKAGTFGAFAQTWLDTVASRKKPATAASYRQIMTNHILPTLGPLPLSDRTIGVQAVADVLAVKQQAGVSWGTQKAILRVISTCCQWAKRTGKLTANPCSRLLKDLRDGTSGADDPEPNPLTAAQAEAFLTWLRTGAVPGRPELDGPRGRGGKVRSPGYPEWYAYFVTLLRTGMRKGEAAGLRWEHVHLDRTVQGRLEPRALLKFNYSPAAAGDVTLKGKRPHEIDLAPVVVDALRTLPRLKSPYVFLTRSGARALPNSPTLDRVFDRGMAALQASGEGHTVHDLRDTFATLHLLADPGRLLWVSWMLGHRQTSTTLNRYARWIPQQVGGANFAGALDAPTAKQKAGQ